MDTLDGTEWDMVISGTGLPQSLLALALSRSGKRILHLDRNDYYGGNEAALSLSEAEEWASRHTSQESVASSSMFSSASATKNEADASDQSRLGSSRAYSLALAPQLLYARSNLPPILVSSRTHNQLEFQAVGSWFIVDSSSQSETTLTRVPNGREDIFQDTSLDLKAKRSLMKFLRWVNNHEEQEDWNTLRGSGFPTLLKSKFGLPDMSHQPLLALSLVQQADSDITTETAVSRIARHLRSIGIFGPGFSAVFPKWGGLAEIAQVACRACAVGGGVYVLNKGIAKVDTAASGGSSLELSGGENVTTTWLIGSDDQLPNGIDRPFGDASKDTPIVTRSISIVSSPLTSLFPRTSEGGVIPAGAVVQIPQGSTSPPVYILVHSGESGECPSNQCILYASASVPQGFDTLDQAVSSFLQSVGEQPAPQVLWKMQYVQRLPRQQSDAAGTSPIQSADASTDSKIITLPPLSTDLALEDNVLDDVKKAWMQITGEGEEGFMKFDAREGTGEDD